MTFFRTRRPAFRRFSHMPFCPSHAKPSLIPEPPNRSWRKIRYASLSLTNLDSWTQYGRRAQPLARHRNAGRRLRQAHHRRRQLLYPVRPRPRSPQGSGPARRPEIERAGGVAKEFDTIAIDDGIAMGHDGMLYSLPSRDLIADSVEYMVNAHCADAWSASPTATRSRPEC